jgi:hypothetical protein
MDLAKKSLNAIPHAATETWLRRFAVAALMACD